MTGDQYVEKKPLAIQWFSTIKTMHLKLRVKLLKTKGARCLYMVVMEKLENEIRMANEIHFHQQAKRRKLTNSTTIA